MSDEVRDRIERAKDRALPNPPLPNSRPFPDRAFELVREMLLPCGCFAYRLDGARSDIHTSACPITAMKFAQSEAGQFGKNLAAGLAWEDRNDAWRLENPWPL